jgi:hypothetical protein
VTAMIKKLIDEQSSSGADINPDEREELNKLLLRNIDRFAVNPKKPTTTSRTTHVIDTGDARPINVPPYRIAKSEEEYIEKEIEEMKENGIIEPSDSPWGFSIVLAMKKDGSKRFCVDYRRLNDVTKTSSYPIPLIADLLDCFNGARYYSSIDLASGYWQIPMDPDSMDKTTFNSKYGSYRFRVMPFGVCNGPATFQRLMDEVFRDMKFKCVCVYFDDVFIYSKTLAEHLIHLQMVFDRLRKYKLQAKASKCQFVAKELIFVGHLVSAEGVRPDPSKIKAVQEWMSPTSTREVREFIGLCGYYRKFVEGFSTVAAPLHRLQSEKVPFEWTPECEQSFQRLKGALISAPLLVMPDFTKPFLLQTDASKEGVGAVLAQLDDAGLEHVIAYASKSLNKAQRNYTTTDQELLAVVYGVRQFRGYLLGRSFKLYTDHDALRWLKTMRMNRDLSGRLARYQMFLMEFQFEPFHKKGTSNTNADALSRMRRRSREADKEGEGNEGVAEVCFMEAVPVELETTPSPQWATLQRADSTLAPMIDYLASEGATVPGDPAERDKLITLMKKGKYRLNGDQLLIHVRYRDGEEIRRIVVPEEAKAEILFQFHGSRLAAHMGVFKTYEKLLTRFHWKNMSRDVQNYVLSCMQCNSRKDRKKAPQFPTIAHVPQGHAMEDISYDALGPFPETSDGNKHILIFMCRLTKWCECFAVASVDERTVARVIAEEITPRFGCPRSILSDGASAFNSLLLEEIYAFINTKKITITPYNPQHNGQVERFNYTLVSMLSMYVNKYQSDWDQHLNVCQFAYRSAINSSTGYSPFLLLYGREPNYPVDAMIKEREYWEDSTDYLSSLIRRVVSAQDVARANLLERQEKLAEDTDQLNYQLDYQFGDKVWFLLPDSKKGLSNKLRSRWQLYSILERTSLLNYRIIRHLHDGESETRLVNVRKLKPHTDPSTLSRIAHQLGCSPDKVMEEYSNVPGRGGEEAKGETEEVGTGAEYEVEAIRGRRLFRNKVQYLVKWKGFSEKENTWEPLSNVVNAGEMINHYEYSRIGMRK